MAAVNMFGDLVCLSQETGTLRLYIQDELQDVFQSNENSSAPILQKPGQPVFDGADLIYLLDRAGQRIFAWDRYLNIHSITDLNDNIISPASFTVTSEHDWLIYDEFSGQILQILPGEGFYNDWGNEPVSGEIELFAINDYVIVYLKDMTKIRISDINGKTLYTYKLPDTLSVYRLFPLDDLSFVLTGPAGVHIWKPRSSFLLSLFDVKNVIHCSKTRTGYRLITQEGVIITTP